MTGVSVSLTDRHRAIRHLSVAIIWVSGVIVAASQYVRHFGRLGWFWTVLGDCGGAFWFVACTMWIYCYLWRRRHGVVEGKVLPNEAQLARLARLWRERRRSGG